ncbi:hypothetical protein BHE74_00003463 [Ensete ventricosum]|nr:hypothetical protein BHE74_00003463 [Ensete ventricosum]
MVARRSRRWTESRGRGERRRGRGAATAGGVAWFEELVAHKSVHPGAVRASRAASGGATSRRPGWSTAPSLSRRMRPSSAPTAAWATSGPPSPASSPAAPTPSRTTCTPTSSASARRRWTTLRGLPW